MSGDPRSDDRYNGAPTGRSARRLGRAMSRRESDARTSKVTLHVVSSLDGFIAKKDNTISWMDSPGDVYAKGVPEGDADDTVASIDCFVLGSRTYEHALELGWPYG